MSELAPYLPLDRRQALARGAELPERCQGAALFADISGFTPLAEALAAQFGPQRAAEELTCLLDQVYSVLIAEVHRWRGSVIGFVGDAITCWFDEPDAGAPLSQAAWRAAACAQAMQAALRPFASLSVAGSFAAEIAIKAGVAGSFTAEIAIKIGLAVGPARRFLLGDPAVQVIEALAGETMRQMSQAEGLARRGETLLSADCAALLAGRATFLEQRPHPENGLAFSVLGALAALPTADPWPPIAAGALDEAQLRHYLLPQLRQRLLAGAAAQPELRPAVSLFLRFSGIDYDHDEQAGGKLDAFIRQVQAVLQRYEGSLLQLTIGDKGSFLYAAFGAPSAHDDDPARAVRAALDLQRQVSALAPQIGVARGPARTGAYGCEARCSYGVIGDDAVLAARLMAAAPPGEVRCAHSIYRALQHKLPFESLPPLRVKGKAGLVAAYRPRAGGADAGGADAGGLGAGGLGAGGLGAGPVPAGEDGMVGREAEMAQLHVALAALQAGQTQALLIEGEAGIGKTRLVEALLGLLHRCGLRALLGAGQSIEQHTPYRAWRDVLEAYFGLEAMPEAEERRRHVQSRLARLAPQHVHLLPLLNDVLHLGWPESELTQALEPKLRQQSLALLLVALLQAWARTQPLALVLEDAHWLDPLSWELLDQAARALEAEALPLLLVAAYRPPEEASPTQAALARLRSWERCQALRLSALPAAALADLAARRLGVRTSALPPALLDLLHERAGGNPFFAEELVFALRDQGVIQSLGDRLHVHTDLEQARQSLPDSLHGLILSRIDRLRPEVQFTLKVAAVIGRVFALAPLHYALAPDAAPAPEALRAQLQALNKADFTFVETLEPELAYAFKHIITQEAAYQTLLFAQRRELHARVAAWYESQLGAAAAQDSAYLPLLAHHYRQAEQPAQERRYARLAGEQAARQYANAPALRYFSRALELTPADEDAERFALLLARERSYDILGERAAQAQDLEALAALAPRLAPGAQAQADLRRAMYADALADFPAALAFARQAAAQAEQAADLETLGQSYHECGRVLWQQSDYAQAHEYLQKALALARQRRAWREEGRSLYDIATVFYRQANYAAAQTHYEQARVIYRSLGYRQGEILCWLMLGAIQDSLGNYAGVQASYRQAILASQGIGWRFGEANALGSLGSHYFEIGDYRGAQTCHERALALAGELGNRSLEAVSLDTLSLVQHILGDDQAAQGYCQRALAIQRAIGDQYGEGYSLNHLGLALEAADPPAAQAAFEQALALRRALAQDALALDDLAGLVRAGLVRAALAQGDLGGALARVEEILAWLAENDAGVSAEAAEFPVLVYLSCYRALKTAGDARAAEVLAAGRRLLHARAGRIQDPALRAQFLEGVPFNKEILSG